VGALDFERLRSLMVQDQLVARGIRDDRVLSAMRKVPRHLFVSEELSHRAYDDMALPTGEGQTISQPFMVAIMTELLELRGQERVLEVGTGSGYQAAILGELAGEVYSIERLKTLSDRAGERLASLGYRNIRLRAGDGTLGWPEEAPFDRILVTAGAPDIPAALTGQLEEEGIIVIPVGDYMSQRLIKGIKRRGKIDKKYHIPCVFVPLMGEFGWKKDRD
jgi:protein-L-isoaspartate(D-aspartate) O-methyltransferase